MCTTWLLHTWVLEDECVNCILWKALQLKYHQILSEESGLWWRSHTCKSLLGATVMMWLTCFLCIAWLQCCWDKARASWISGFCNPQSLWVRFLNKCILVQNYMRTKKDHKPMLLVLAANISMCPMKWISCYMNELMKQIKCVCLISNYLPSLSMALTLWKIKQKFKMVA